MPLTNHSFIRYKLDPFTLANIFAQVSVRQQDCGHRERNLRRTCRITNTVSSTNNCHRRRR